MYSGHFVICDPDKEYSENLMKFISEMEKIDLQFQIFHEEESLMSFSKRKPIDILLIAEEYDQDGKFEKITENKFVLTKNEQDKRNDQKRIYRYQSAENIIKILFEDAEQDKKDNKDILSIRKKQDTDRIIRRKGLIGIYSPVHRIGKTKFAIQLGIKSAKYVPTLYLNLEEYPASGLYYPDQKEKNIGDLLFYAGQNTENLGFRINTIAGQIENLDYIMPIPILQDLRQVKVDEWLNLFEQILKKCIYETIILDLSDSVDGLYTILQNCSVIYTHYAEEPTSEEKVRQYEQNIKRMGMEAILEHTIRKKVTRRNKNLTTDRKEGMKND